MWTWGYGWSLGDLGQGDTHVVYDKERLGYRCRTICKSWLVLGGAASSSASILRMSKHHKQKLRNCE